ncbi:MAG: NTP transferase domain-containing protein [Methanospirillum sp.]|uniref:sugar phosphate nucleotidyltransferase n=1 Tax=Methanospirillum sp. TaxID=45200 RepID=UPI00237388CC|nr:sugar phosphate nucleotidyltransferase [Methanospirillum sp.]MDD1730099.1 NTP transferase domain-containing protein [Methanospirillum sp.]
MTVQAVILAAGEGTRLRPLTQNRPKALIPVGNRPILEHLVDSLLKCGIRDIIVVVGYRKEQVMQHLIRLPVQVRVVEQKDQLGTGHALFCARDLISDDLLVLPGDNYVDPLSLKELLQISNSMLITTHIHPSNFGVVQIEDGLVKGIIEKPAHANRMTVSCGVYYLKHAFLADMTEFNLTDAINTIISKGNPIAAVYALEWQDAIYPWDLLSMNSRLLRQTSSSRAGTISAGAIIEGVVSIGRGSVIGPHCVIRGPTVIGDDCVISSNVVINPDTSIGSRVVIEPFSVLGDSLVMDDCIIASHSTVTSAVMGEACTLGEHTIIKPGSGIIEMGDEAVRSSCGVIMGNGVVSSPMIIYENSIVGNDCQIDGNNGPLRLRSKVIPDHTRVM